MKSISSIMEEYKHLPPEVLDKRLHTAHRYIQQRYDGRIPQGAMEKCYENLLRSEEGA